MALPSLPPPPLTHPCSPLSSHPPSPVAIGHPFSNRWSRRSGYFQLFSALEEDDGWWDGAMGTPLVGVGPKLTADVDHEDATIGRSMYERIRTTGGQTRWSRFSEQGLNDGLFADTAAVPQSPQICKRKRWSNSIGSATSSVMGNVRNSLSRFNTVPVMSEADKEDDERNPGKGKRRRLSRVLREVSKSTTTHDHACTMHDKPWKYLPAIVPRLQAHIESAAVNMVIQYIDRQHLGGLHYCTISKSHASTAPPYLPRSRTLNKVPWLFHPPLFPVQPPFPPLSVQSSNPALSQNDGADAAGTPNSQSWKKTITGTGA
ncbi:MAG: hypothetical protein Q9181_003276 [Wetmoreana brouardii]